MKDLNDAMTSICDLKGSVFALQAALTALLRGLPPSSAANVQQELETERELAETALLHGLVSEGVREAFARDMASLQAGLDAAAGQPGMQPNEQHG